MKTKFNLRELLLGDTNRLRYVRRYSNSLTLHQENVAEHSYYVMLYSHFLERWVFENRINLGINRDLLMQKALFHDMDEGRTGDFQRPFKYSMPGLSDMLHEASKIELRKMIEPIAITPTHKSVIVSTWVNSKDDSMEGTIVALADYMAVLSFMAQELQVVKSTMLDTRSMLDYSKSLDDKRYDFLRPIVDLVQEMTRTSLGGNK